MNLLERIEQRKARIGVVGLGYVGLPLAVEFARAGFHVTGIDVDRRKVESIRRGRSYVMDVSSRELAQTGLRATTDFESITGLDAVIICVPTPLRKSKDPDVSYILSALEKVARHLHRGMLVILESTTYPGTTKELMLPKLAGSGLKVGRDFFLAFSPERVDPSNAVWRVKNTPKIVGGITPACTEAARRLYAAALDTVLPVSSCEAAEMAKLLENTFRAVNIGLVNEVALMCDRLGLNVWEVIEAAASKPFGFMPFYPGPGIGGHCIPLDPYYLSWKLKTLNFYARFIELAGEINSKMPEFVVEKLSRVLNERGRPLKGSRIFLLGVAYKPNVSDTRESPALDVIHLLEQRGARVSYHDPHVPSLDGRRGARLTPAELRQADCVVVTTAHKAFQPKEILRHARLVYDTRNLMRGLRHPKLIRL